jgi:hypothetical protein
MLSKRFFEELEKPFPIEDVSVRVGMKRKDGTAALPLFYLQAEAVRKRFDLTCEMEGATWSYDFQIVASPSDHVATNIDSKTLAVKATITVFKENLSVSRSSIGEETFANENTEVYKSAETDAFKRAAARFGVGGYLRQLEKMWFPLNEKGYFAESETEIIKKVYEQSGVKVEKVETASVSASKGLNRRPKAMYEIVTHLEYGIEAIKDSLKKPCPFLDEAFQIEYEKKNGLKRGSWWSIQSVFGKPIRSYSFEEMEVIAEKVAEDVNESNFEAALVLSKALPVAARYPEYFGTPTNNTVKTL